MLYDLKEVMKGNSEEQLLEILESREDYRPEAIEAAKEELKKRGVSKSKIQVIEKMNEKADIKEKKSFVISIFSRKQKISLEKFCRDFYDSQILNPVIGGVDVSLAFSEVLIKDITVVDPSFSTVDKQKLTYELTVMRFELFALAWTHNFPDKLFSQSIFTYKYLHEKRRDDIWESMNDYNRAIKGSVTLGLSAIKYAWDMEKRANLSEKQKKTAENNGTTLSDYVLESIYRPINRRFSKKAWETGATIYGLGLVLCKNLGLGDGASRFGLFGVDISAINFGINPEARFYLSKIINDFYDEAKQSLNKVKIKN